MITSHLPQQNLRNNFINNEFCQFRKRGVGISVKASRVFWLTRLFLAHNELCVCVWVLRQIDLPTQTSIGIHLCANANVWYVQIRSNSNRFCVFVYRVDNKCFTVNSLEFFCVNFTSRSSVRILIKILLKQHSVWVGWSRVNTNQEITNEKSTF